MTGALPLSPDLLERHAPTLVVLAVMLIASAFLAATETAVFSLPPSERRQLSDERAGRRLLGLLQRRDALVTSLLLGRDTLNVALAATASTVLAGIFPGGPWLPVLVLTPLLVVLAEVTPRAVGLRWNRSWSRFASLPLAVFHHAVTPVRLAFSGLVSGLARLGGADPARTFEGLAEEDLLMILDQGTASGEFDPVERDIVEAVLEFDELTVERLMTPRTDMFCVPLDTPWPDLLRQARDHGYSRIPVYEGRADEIVGVLLLKDLLKHRRAPPAGPRQLRTLLIPPVFVPGSKSADAMLQEFLEKRFHMAFVVDEHGGVMGLVTLDDLLAELLGELDGDTEESEIERIRPGSLVVQAHVDVDDFAEETGIELPEGEYHTVGGFVFHQLGRLPLQGDVVAWGGHVFRVTAMDGRRIAEVAIQVGAAERAEREEAVG